MPFLLNRIFSKKKGLFLRKKTFILLEVLIAFTLVVFITFPFIKRPFEILKTQIHTLEEVECETIVEESFAEIVTLLYQNKIDWNDLLSSKKQSAKLFFLEPKKIQLLGFNPKEIHRSFYILSFKEKKGLKNNVYRRLKIVLKLSSKTLEKEYFHSVIVENDFSKQ